MPNEDIHVTEISRKANMPADLKPRHEGMPPPKPKKQAFPMIPMILNGGIAGCIGLVSIFPVDLVKTRLQNQNIGPNGERQYKSLVDCFVKTFKAEGFFGMYKGCLVNSILVTPEKAIKLASNDYFRHLLRESDEYISMPAQVLAGAGSGACQSIITSPMELLKIAMQDQGRVRADAKARGLPHKDVTVPELVRKLGFFGLYRGMVPIAAREIGFSIIYFPMLSTIATARYKDSSEITFLWSFMSGGLAGGVSAVLVTPLDVVNTRMQTITRVHAAHRVYNNYFDAFRKIYGFEGWRAFFKGGTCRLVTVGALFAITQMVYYVGIGERIMGQEKYKPI